MGTLDKAKVEKCKVEESAGNNAGAIEDEINAKLIQGWTFRGIIIKGNKVYLVFIK